eukprot:1156549-Pelagomonas_calceolata.AAC.2
MANFNGHLVLSPNWHGCMLLFAVLHGTLCMPSNGLCVHGAFSNALHVATAEDAAVCLAKGALQLL